MIIPPVGRFRLLVAIGSLCVVVALLAFHAPILRAAGWALVAEDAIGPADVIIVPQWAGEAGALEAADLVRAGLATRVAVLVGTSAPADEELVRRRILTPGKRTWLTGLIRALGVETVEEIPHPADGTESEGELLPEWTTSHGFHSIIVVTTADHSRRVRRVLHRSMKGRNINVMIRSARYSGFVPDGWWKSRGGMRTEIVELEKLFLDIIRYPIS